MSITLKQIAKLAGVSRSTVSRVINNRPGVRPQTRERIQQIVREYGYEPHSSTRSLAVPPHWMSTSDVKDTLNFHQVYKERR